MSMFGLGGGNSGHAPSGSINPAQIEMATAELDMITDVFNRLVSCVYPSGTREHIIIIYMHTDRAIPSVLAHGMRSQT